MKLISILGALFFSLTLATQVAASTWSAPREIGSQAFMRHGLTSTGPASALLTYTEGQGADERVWSTRTADSGAHWSSAVALTTSNAFSVRAASYGSDADVVFLQGSECNLPNSSMPCRLWFRHSSNGGAAFGTATALTPSADHATRPQLARGPNGRVIVSWSDQQARVRVLDISNGGTTFGPVVTLGATAYGAAVAVGNGVIYAAFDQNIESLVMRVSRDDGATWSSKILANNGGVLATLSAAGNVAYVAYGGTIGGTPTARYRRTTDAGATWQKPVNLSSPSGKSSDVPEVLIDSLGVVHALFERCLDSACVNSQGGDGGSAAFYRQSTDGTHWSAAERVSTNIYSQAFPAGLAFAGAVIVVYTEANVGEFGHLYIRTRS